LLSSTEETRSEDNLLIYSLKDVSLVAPGGDKQQPLISNLHLEVKVGDKGLLINGRSSAGKSSLLRILRGLWPLSKGSVRCGLSEDRAIFFLPQRPFFTDGSIWDQVRII